ncbi:MAG: nucleotide sugar dehydrogenase [bacterium]
MYSKIDRKTAIVGVMGLGYVGLPLAVEFARAGFKVMGIDPDRKKISALSAGKSYVNDVTSADLENFVRSGSLAPVSDPSALGDCDVIFICVPTPFSRFKEPDVSYIIQATRQILEHMKKGQLVILESTTFPGTTEEVVLPILESRGMKCGTDFFLAFSPERVDPGNRVWNIRNTPKVIGGVDEESTRLSEHLYSKIISRQMVVRVSSPRIAEMTKLLENIFRSVNIALINELTFLCDRMNIDIWEVIDAASSKPFGFMPFYPGPGVGGHCIPVDPYYLSWKAREYDFYTKFIELAAEINQSMPRYVVNKVGEALNQEGKSLKNAKVLALGVAFKRDINDARNSPALKVIEELICKGASVVYHDPFIRGVGNGSEFFDVESGVTRMRSARLTEKLLREQDCVVILVDHEKYNVPFITKHARLIVDTRNVTKGFNSKGARIVKI